MTDPTLEREALEAGVREPPQVDGFDPGATEVRRLCTVLVGPTWLALDVDMVDEITKLHDSVTSVPGAPDYVPGIMVLRGRPLALLDLRRYLELPDSRDEDMEDRVVVVSVPDMRVGCICDRVGGIERVLESRLRVPDAVQGKRLTPHVDKMFEHEGGLAFIVDLPSLLNAAKT